MGRVSLRLRLIGLIAAALGVSLAIGATMAVLNASRSVATEMQAALRVADQAVETALAADRAEPWQHRTEAVIAAFAGNRHVRLRLEGSAIAAVPAVEEPVIGEVPGWFVRMVQVEPARLRLPLGQGREAAVVIETDPHNEIVETWTAFCDTLLVLLLFCGLTLALVHVLVGRALLPLGRLCAALASVGRGDFAARIGGRLAPELAPLRDSFADMATRLAAADERNRRLTEKLLTLQEDERRDIARDLHDEIGPLLFAVNVDAAAVTRLARAGRTGEIPGAVAGIEESVRHMQEQVRHMLGRLRPAGLAEFGLADALRHLVEFWRPRQPQIEFRLDLSPGDRSFGDLLDITIFRLVQEGLSNAVRHGQPSEIAVALRLLENGASVAVEVADDGRGPAASGAGGFGLLGMAERVRGLGGAFTSEARAGGGFLVRAILPRSRPSDGTAEPALADPISAAAA
jgi:two-component system sensor histidine kinase UhpB